MYLAANGIIMGKAALDELQDGGNSVNPTHQYADGLITTMLNAYNQSRIAGGMHLHCSSALLFTSSLLVVAKHSTGKLECPFSVPNRRL